MPYFLYPGMKLKDSVKRKYHPQIKNLKMVITKPLSYDPMMTEVVTDRIRQLKNEQKIQYSDHECDILLIGHGGSAIKMPEMLSFIWLIL